MDMYHHLVLLADISFHLGLIGLPEYEERLRIAAWLAGNVKEDPRGEGEIYSAGESREFRLDSRDVEIGNGNIGSSTNSDEDDPDPILRLLILNIWHFTISDPDSYPSVPHGHWGSKTNEWPKLNPYSGRVYLGVHKEDRQSRLGRDEMKRIWNDAKFIEHCRDQINWYIGFAPRYRFPNARRGIYSFPKW